MDSLIEGAVDDENKTKDNVFNTNFGAESEESINTYREALEFILKNGAVQGVHVVLQIDKPKQLLFSDDFTLRSFYNDMFHHLVALNCNDTIRRELDLSDDLSLENLCSDNERLRAVYYNYVNNKYTLFSPFV